MGYALAFSEATQSCLLDSRNMQKHIIAAPFRLYETKPLAAIEPFYLANGHFTFSTLSEEATQSRLKGMTSVFSNIVGGKQHGISLAVPQTVHRSHFSFGEAKLALPQFPV